MIKELVHELELVYGIPIKNGIQCRDLSEFIFRETGTILSFQTLRRFFGFIKTDSATSINTLNTIAKVVGYRHYDDFCKTYKGRYKNSNPIELVYSISLRKEFDLNYHLVCRNIAYTLYNNLNELEPLITFLSQSKVAQVYFFERFPFIDHLQHPIYKRALLQYKQKTKSIESDIFVDSLLYLSEHLKSGTVQPVPASISIHYIHKLHPFLQGRVLGSLLIWLDKKETVLKKLLNTVKKNIYHSKENLLFLYLPT